MSTRGWIIAAAVVVVLAAGAVGFGLWIARPTGPRIEVTADSAPIMVGSKEIARAAKGDRFRVLGARDSWYQVSVATPDGERIGWIQASLVRRVDAPPPDAGCIEASVFAIHYPDAVIGELPPWGKRWLLAEVQVRALQANDQGACAIHTDRFVLGFQKLRLRRPRYWKTVQVAGRNVNQLLKHDVVRLPVGDMKLLRLILTVDSRLVVRHGWTVDYVPPEPDAAIRLGTPKPATAAPPKPATATQPATAASK